MTNKKNIEVKMTDHLKQIKYIAIAVVVLEFAFIIKSFYLKENLMSFSFLLMFLSFIWVVGMVGYIFAAIKNAKELIDYKEKSEQVVDSFLSNMEKNRMDYINALAELRKREQDEEKNANKE